MRIKFLILFLLIIAIKTNGQIDSTFISFDEVKYDTTTLNVFKGSENARIKIDYYHSDGYSLHDRYWYEIVIIDSLVIFNFKSPDNSDWDYINYQKQTVIDDSIRDNLIFIIKKAGIKQKKKGIPIPPASGYSSNELFIETPDIKVAGGNVCITISGEETEKIYNERINKEMKLSSTIDGDYDLVFKSIESLFKELDFLFDDMRKNK
jgi:hypothetical protein